jgi:hypothetical protein
MQLRIMIRLLTFFSSGDFRVGANANCLCYISPAVRRNVRRWRNGRNPILSCIAVLLWKSHA